MPSLFSIIFYEADNLIRTFPTNSIRNLRIPLFANADIQLIGLILFLDIECLPCKFFERNEFSPKVCSPGSIMQTITYHFAAHIAKFFCDRFNFYDSFF